MRSSAWPRTAVFLDRDGTIIRDTGYLSDPAAIEILPGAVEALRALNEALIPAIIVTNQSGIARGYFDEAALDAVHARLIALLADSGARIDRIYYCPHLADGAREKYRIACTCRKPEPGMLIRAADDFGLDLERCYLVGDKPIDIETIHRVGGKGVLVGLARDQGDAPRPDFSADNLLDAVAWIVDDLKK
jgi:D-glycero-D-manno-heptose 1,7-bisphosphate phosphatase